MVTLKSRHERQLQREQEEKESLIRERKAETSQFDEYMKQVWL